MGIEKEKGEQKMKKVIAFILITVAALSAFSLTASAYVGTGIEVAAGEVTVIKSGLLGRKLSFSDIDFKSAFALDDFGKIKILTLPASTDGTLLLAGRRVREGQEIKRRNIAAMVFVPAEKTVERAEFTFSLDGGTECYCRMRFIDKINYAPKIKEGTESASLITTQREISAYGKMSAEDPEGDRLEYMVVSFPQYGTLKVGEGGEYRYMPTVDYTGYDSFVYVARDEYGNYSTPCEVNLKVVDRMSEIVFCDMTDKEEYNAAVAMSAMGIMAGRLVGDDYYFDPETGVSREEFVAMAMKAHGIRAGVGESYFDDNSEISPSLVGYISLAQRMGIIDGEYEGGRLTFSPKKEITVYEAADVISRMLGAAGGEEDTVYHEAPHVPVWARGSVQAMVSMGILDKDVTLLGETMKRRDVADMLYRMVNNS